MPNDKSENIEITNSTFDIQIVLSLAYLAPVEYYQKIVQTENVYIEQFENFEKQSYRNRCRIVTSNGLMDLIVPVEKNGKELIRDIKISEHNNWQAHHWKSIEAAYNSSPFFEYYKDDFLTFYTSHWKYLWDFNMALQEKVFELLEIDKQLLLTKEFKKEYCSGIIDLRNEIHPKKVDVNSNLKPYYQVFESKTGFQSNLSIIDVLFNMGNESQLIIS